MVEVVDLLLDRVDLRCLVDAEVPFLKRIGVLQSARWLVPLISLRLVLLLWKEQPLPLLLHCGQLLLLEHTPFVSELTAWPL